MSILKKANSVEKQWQLINLDSGGGILTGQFATEINQEIRNNWEHHTALSRSRAISQYVNSEVDRISFEALFYANTVLEFTLLNSKLSKILEWAKPTQQKNRPAILQLSVGNGFFVKTCVIAGVSNIKYSEPTVTGNLRQVSFTLNLDEYHDFDINETSAYETRYHFAKERDYYEMLCFREYGIPELGDVIRKRHPEQATLFPGEVVKLPSVEAIQATIVQPTSVALKSAFGRKPTPQRSLRIDYFNRRNKKYVSHIIRS